jgi:hypothetical protein
LLQSDLWVEDLRQVLKRMQTARPKEQQQLVQQLSALADRPVTSTGLRQVLSKTPITGDKPLMMALKVQQMSELLNRLQAAALDAYGKL